LQAVVLEVRVKPVLMRMVVVVVREASLKEVQPQVPESCLS
jgi:hypothetical protein